MQGFEGEQIYHADQGLIQEMDQEDTYIINNDETKKKFRKFIQNWNTQNKFIKTQLQDNIANRKYLLEVFLDDLNNFDSKLSEEIKERPLEIFQIFEEVCKEIGSEFLKDLPQIPNFQVQIFSQENPRPLRELKSNMLNKLITIQGIIVNAQRVQLKARNICIECKNCHHVKYIQINPGISAPVIPRYCETLRDPSMQKEKCPIDSYVIIPNRSEIIDQQSLKLQETPESVPTGEIPRSFQICVDRYLTDKLIPGTRVKLTGIYTLVEKKVLSTKANQMSLKTPYIYILGYQTENMGSRKMDTLFSLEEEEQFKQFAKDPKIYEKISKSIGSAIYGSMDIKKAIACLLFGGSRKILPDKTKLRGDINILLIGDPSTAKSQFLKFVERTAPIGIYTSGKGSSAAGLTASIVRDNSSGEFQLEGGAMVLGDGGIVCIDEFDKMSPQDRVSIHEAMEQQTISVAKAGITTILNSRTSVLAAANPIFGKYDDLKQISDQIDLQTTILSRFDCIFVVKDIKNEEHDKTLANHVLNLHMGEIAMDEENNEFDINILRRFIHYARCKCSPRLSEEAANALSNFYVEDRKGGGINKKRKSHIPITVRQLEAMIRLSEALSKMNLSNTVTIDHVKEAHRLFQVSTLNAISSGLDMGVEIPGEIAQLVMKVEDSVKRRVPIGGRISYAKLTEEQVQRFNNLKAVELAIVNMVRQDEFQQIEGKKVLIRKK